MSEPKIIVPKNLEVQSGVMVHLNIVVTCGYKGVAVSNISIGVIDHWWNFYAPRVYSDKLAIIRVHSVDFPDLAEEISIKIKALKFIINNPAKEVYACDATVNFGIEIENDERGINYFKCAIISGEGEITVGGFYTPPQYLTFGGLVIIEAISVSDGNVKLRHSFILHPPKCKVCGKVLALTGICPEGHESEFVVKMQPKKSFWQILFG